MREIARLTGWQSARQIADGCETSWRKAHEMGRGPAYESPPELGPLFPPTTQTWHRPRGIERRIHELQAVRRGEDRLVLQRSEQAHYALGLLSVERDLHTLRLKDEEEEKQ